MSKVTVDPEQTAVFIMEMLMAEGVKFPGPWEDIGLKIEDQISSMADTKREPVELTAAENEFVSEMWSADPPTTDGPWQNFDPDFKQKDIARLIRRGWFERKNEKGYRSYRWTAAGRSALRAEREG